MVEEEINDDENRSDSEYILKVELTGFPVRLNVNCEVSEQMRITFWA